MVEINYKIGDSRDLLKTIPSDSIHLVVTSPPYWNAKDYELQNQIGFEQSYDDYIFDLNLIWKECSRVLAPNGKICIDLQPLPVPKSDKEGKRSSIFNIMRDVEVFMKEIDFSLSNMIIWDKRKYNNQKIFGSYPYPPNLYSHTSFEFIYVFRKFGKTKKVDPKIKEQSKISKEEWVDWCFNSIWDIPPVIKFGKNKEDILGHIAPFPIEIPRRLIKLFTFIGETVLDPFLGAGTTLGACILENRNGIGFELNPKFEPLINQIIKFPKKVPKYKEIFDKKNFITLDKF